MWTDTFSLNLSIKFFKYLSTVAQSDSAKWAQKLNNLSPVFKEQWESKLVK